MSKFITLKQTHIRIEQGLQSVGVFAYSDSLHQEIDLSIEGAISNLIETILDKKKRIGGFQGKQVSLDDLRLIQEKDKEIATTKIDDETYGISLPTDYNHMIKVSSKVSRTCEGRLHIKKANCRITKSDIIDTIKGSLIGKTSPSSPIVEISGETLYGYVDTSFAIDNFIITYLRNPKKLAYTSVPTTGLITANDNMEFTFDTTLKIIDDAIIKLAVYLEQKQQKIVNLAQTKQS